MGDAVALPDSASRFPHIFPRASMRLVLISHICMHSVSLSIQQITSYQFLLIDITISRPYSVQQTKRVGKWEFRKEPPNATHETNAELPVDSLSNLPGASPTNAFPFAMGASPSNYLRRLSNEPVHQ